MEGNNQTEGRISYEIAFSVAEGRTLFGGSGQETDLAVEDEIHGQVSTHRTSVGKNMKIRVPRVQVVETADADDFLLSDSETEEADYENRRHWASRVRELGLNGVVYMFFRHSMAHSLLEINDDNQRGFKVAEEKFRLAVLNMKQIDGEGYEGVIPPELRTDIAIMVDLEWVILRELGDDGLKRPDSPWGRI